MDNLVERARQVAELVLKDEMRSNGVPFIAHPDGVAAIVRDEIGLPQECVAAVYLHEASRKHPELDLSEFPSDVLKMVDGLNRISTIRPKDTRLEAENYKKLIVQYSSDPRVTVIKIADRLEIMRNLSIFPKTSREQKQLETLMLYIPLAHQLGLYNIKSELEDIYFKFSEPEQYRSIKNKLAATAPDRERLSREFIEPLKSKLDRAGIHYKVKVRTKTAYSIYKKMLVQKVPFEGVYDVFAIRFIIDAPEDRDVEKALCWKVFSLVTEEYESDTKRLRDWLTNPKPNGYESLHITVRNAQGNYIEVQIRTKRMDDIAEKGIAAHWAYKNEGYVTENDSEMDKWLKKVQEILLSNDVSALELLDIIHNDLISTEIVVFTPKGEQKSIVNGATALDFAYMIHSGIGSKAIAAKINMKLVPLSQPLKAGDQVEIITAANATPKMEWLQFLKTRYARSRVIDFFRDRREELVQSGARIFDERIHQMGFSQSNSNIRKFLDYCQLRDAEELFFRVGLGILGAEDFKKILTEDKLIKNDGTKLSPKDSEASKRKYSIAECCKPIPGDSVIGFLTEDHTVIVHKKSCPIAESLASKYGNRVVVPDWTAKEKEYPIRLSLKGIDRLGIMNDISFFISKTLGINMRRLSLWTEGGVFEGYIELLVKDKKILENMIDGLLKIEGIQNVLRTDI